MRFIPRPVGRATLLLSALAMLPLSVMAQSNDERRAAIEKRTANPSAEGLARKERSIKRLRSEGVPVIEHLPTIADSAEVKARGREELAHRAIAVVITALKGEGLEQALVDSLVKKFSAEKFFTPKEATFIKDPSPSEQNRVQFSWRYEAAWVLMWSLGYVDHLARPDSICDVPKLASLLRDLDTAQFIRDAKLRPLSELLDEADLIYRYHWAVVEARLKGKPAPARLEGGVVQERHYALNWLIGYMGSAWDDISTDT